MSVEKINVEITGKDAGASAAMKSVQGSMLSLGNVAKSAGMIFAGLKIVDFFKDAAAEAMEAERVNKVFENAIINIAHATDAEVEALRNKAEALQAVGVVEDDAIMQGQAQLATFAMSTEAIGALSGAMADFAVNQNNGVVGIEQMNDAANIFGKLMSGNTAAIGQLQKTGIVFTEAQKNVLAYGTEMEKAAAIQEVMAANLKLTNEVMANTTEGAMIRATMAWNGFKQSVGEIMMPIIASVLEFANQMITIMSEGLARLREGWDSDWGGIRSTVEAVWSFLVEEVVPVALDFFELIKAGFTLFMIVWAPMWEGIKLVVSLVWEELKMIVKIAWELVSGIITAGAAALRGDWDGAWAAIKDTFFGVWGAMKDFVFGVVDAIMSYINGMIDLINGAITAVKNLLGMQGQIKSGTSPTTRTPVSRKATGGMVTANTPYLVGENEPELFVPNMSGSIIPASKMGGGTVVVNVYGDVSGQEVADKIFEKAIKKFGLHTKFA